MRQIALLLFATALHAQTVTEPAVTVPSQTIKVTVPKNGAMSIVIPAQTLPARTLSVNASPASYTFTCTGTPVAGTQGQITITNLVCTAVKQ